MFGKKTIKFHYTSTRMAFLRKWKIPSVGRGLAQVLVAV